MNRGIFIAGTGTDIGKTYVTALLIKKLRSLGIHAGYYKAAVSGAGSLEESDAGYVNKTAEIHQDYVPLLSYLYKTPVSPHLAARLEGNPVSLDKIKKDFMEVSNAYEFVVMEGSGGIVCPIRYDDSCRLFLEDIIQALELPTLVVADAGLGTINAAVLTAEYLKHRNLPVRGILLNHFTGGVMEDDNIKMIEEITGLPVLSLIPTDAKFMNLSEEALTRIMQSS